MPEPSAREELLALARHFTFKATIEQHGVHAVAVWEQAAEQAREQATACQGAANSPGSVSGDAESGSVALSAAQVPAEAVEAAISAWLTEGTLPYMARAVDFCTEGSAGATREAQLAALKAVDDEADQRNGDLMRRAVEAAMAFIRGNEKTSRVLSAVFACNSADCPRPFALYRSQDVSGVSGEGTVAHGVRFADGQVVIRWLGEYASTVVWESLDAAMKVHGHDGRTRVVWLATDFSEMALAEKEATAAERERIITLADHKRAVYCIACDGGPCDYDDDLRPFADLLRGSGRD